MDLPCVTILVPVFNGADSLRLTVASALRQVGIDVHVVIILHGSEDASPDVARELAIADARVEIVTLDRCPDDRSTPARPLNVGLRKVLAQDHDPKRSWIFRLDSDDLLWSDDVVQHQLAVGRYRQLTMGTAIIFNPVAECAYLFGPHPKRRKLDDLRHNGSYCVAHQSNAIRLDLLRRLYARRSDIVDESLDFGEDLMLTCALLREVTEDQFAFVDAVYCMKKIGESSATDRLNLSRVFAAHVRLVRANSEVSPGTAIRGIAELALSRLTSERSARIFLHRTAGYLGWISDMQYSAAAERITELQSSSS